MTPAAKITKLYANGDSSTYGHGLSEQGWREDWGDDPRNHVYALAHSWPSIMAREHGWEYVNHAAPGGSNDRIVRTTIAHICSNDTKDTMVIIGWTNPLRREVHCMDHPTSKNPNDPNTCYRKLMSTWHGMSDIPGSDKWLEQIQRYGWDEVESHVRYFNQVLLLSSFLEQRNIPYLFFNTLTRPLSWTQSPDRTEYERKMTGTLCDSVDWTKFVSQDGNTDRWLDRLIHTAGMMMPCAHPNQQGHQLIAAELQAELRLRHMI